MKKFYGVQLYTLANLFGQMRGALHGMKQANAHYKRAHQAELIDDEMKKDWAKNMLTPMYVLAVSSGLKSSSQYLERIVRKLGESITTDDLMGMLNQLHERLEDDLKDEVLLQVPQERAKYYKPTELINFEPQEVPLFGSAVDSAFPSARYDIGEAGKCLALDRGTACVMHLARAVEVGLKVLAEKELKLPTRHNWGRHLDDIEKELTKRYKTTGSRTTDEKFYAEAAAQIGHIKVAWRNPAMHVDRKYTEDEAEKILLAIEAFMQQLAGRIHE